MDDDINLSADMENEIFNMKDIEKMTNYVDNRVETNIDLTNKKYKKEKNKLPAIKEYIDAPITEVQTQNKIKSFETNLQKDKFNNDYNPKNDSDAEEENITDKIDSFTDKEVIIERYNIIQKKLQEKNSQLDYMRSQIETYKKKNNEILNSLQNSKSADSKDKKLIELVKKNQDLNLKIEKYKLKESTLTKQLNESEKEINNLKNDLAMFEKNKEMTVDQIELTNLKKNVKQNEARLSELRNKLQLTKEENTKLNIIIKREVGDTFDLNKAVNDKNYFKPRAEIIDSLKIKIKQLENKIQIQNEFDSKNNSMSLNTGGNTCNNSTNLNMKDNSNKSFVSNCIPQTQNLIPYTEYKKEKEAYKTQIEQLKADLQKTNENNNKLKLRKNVLEKELKSQKEELTSKLKILIEKSDNDEKLIVAMKNELLRKGYTNLGNYFEDPTFNLNQEINKLRQEIKQKDEYINNITSALLPDTNIAAFNDMTGIQSQLDSQSIGQLIMKVKKLEKENKELKNKSEESKISDALAKENAKLRMKIKDLEDRISGS